MLANPRPLVATIYNPHNQSKEALIAGFVARKSKFERLFRDIREAPMTAPEQHYLIQGLRGMGKTTLLLRLAYEIENTPDLHERLIPIVFNEEEYGMSSLADLWERTAQYLEEEEPLFAGLYDTIIAQYGVDDYERRAIDTLTTALQQHGKKLLLLIDNIGDLLRKLDSTEAKRLREVLLTSRDLRVVGASATVLDQTHNYAKPFYEFFKVIHLTGLTRDESIELFLKLGETYHTDAVKQIVERQPGRIEAIRRLTSGVIRTMVLLFEIMVEDNSGSVFKDLNVLLDRVTPLYKHRMDDLPTQQQKIVAALAQAWDAANARELAEAVRLDSKLVSAQLKQLINNGLVEKVETNTKNHLYRLEERFFNIWYLMRFGRKTDQRVLWLVRFFEMMFEGDEAWLQERVEGHLRAIETGMVEEEAALYLTKAYIKVLKDEELENLLIQKTRVFLEKAGKTDWAIELGDSKYEKITELMEEGHYGKIIETVINFNKLNTLNFSDYFYCIYAELINYLENEFDNSWKNVEIFEIVNGLDFRKEIEVNLPQTLSDEVWKRELFRISMAIVQLRVLTSYLFVKARSRRILFTNQAKKLISVIQTFLPFEFESFVFLQFAYAWNNEFELLADNLEVNHNQIEKNQAIREYLSTFQLLELLLKLLLAKKQYHTAYNYFQQEEWQLKDRFKPLYYATLYFLRDEHPTDYLRMGPELRETVDDVLAEVVQMAIDYA